MAKTNLEHSDERYATYTGKASDIVRQLAFVAVALVWLFAQGAAADDLSPTEVLGNVESSASLRWALVLTLVGLFLDLLQYVWGATAWGLFHWMLEQLTGDRPPSGARRSVAWALAKVFRFRRRLEFDLGLISEGAKVRPSRDAVADALSRAPQSSVASVWAPAWISRGTAALFAGKVLALGAAYVELIVFVVN